MTTPLYVREGVVSEGMFYLENGVMFGLLAKGEMILEFAPDCTKNKEMKQYLLDRGLDLEEVNENVD